MLSEVEAVVPAEVVPRNTSYPVTPTLSLDVLHDRVHDVAVILDETRLVGAVGGWVSEEFERVVTLKVVLVGEIFPAASFASAIMR